MSERGGAPQDDYFAADSIAATTNPFYLRGGLYGVLVEGDFTGTGTITLQAKAASGTYVTVLTAFSADGYATVYLPAGIYIFTVTSTIATTYASIAPIPVRSRL